MKPHQLAALLKAAKAVSRTYSGLKPATDNGKQTAPSNDSMYRAVAVRSA